MEHQPNPHFKPTAEAGLAPVNKKAYTERVSGTIRSIETAGEEHCNAWVEKRLEYGRLFQNKTIDKERIANMKAELDEEFALLTKEEKAYVTKKYNAIKLGENMMRGGNV